MCEKKKMLFVCYGMGIGGIEKCMVNLLNVMPEEKYDVDLMLIDPIYDMLPQIRRKYHLVDSFLYTLNPEFTMREIRKRGGFWQHREKLLPYVEYRIRSKLGLPNWNRFKAPETCYDVAVAYSQNGLGPYYVADKVRAKRKVLWYHNGAYERTGKAYARDRRYYSRFDDIVAVSEACAAMLKGYFPELEEKILVLHNITDARDVREKAGAFVPESYTAGKKHIVTVGRLSAEKGPHLALEACRILTEKGYDIQWHWVGDGNLAEEIRGKVDQLGLRERFVLEGNQLNPYPFIACGDIYVQPSYYESYSNTVTEAKILHRPMVITGVGGMKNRVMHGVTGMVVPVDHNAIADSLEQLLNSTALCEAMQEALKREEVQAESVLRAYETTVFG